MPKADIKEVSIEALRAAITLLDNVHGPTIYRLGLALDQFKELGREEAFKEIKKNNTSASRR